MSPTVSVCIAVYKRDPFLAEALASVEMQEYKNKEVCIYYDDIGIGTGEAFNKAIELAKGDIIILLCSDDVFTDPHVIGDIVEAFKTGVSHVSRYYYQFSHPDKMVPVRAWRSNNVLELGNNPSGLAFRRDVLIPLTNKMFIEVAMPVLAALHDGWSILKYDTVAVRIHQSISRTPGYYKKMWTSSPVEEWAKLGWKTTDYTHLIQVGVNFEKWAVHSEARAFRHVNPWCILNPAYWFFYAVSLLPSGLLYKIPEIYRATWGRMTTRKICRKN
jgi:glycosyltransferase involved in cell wall biosynthesis